MTAQPTYTEAPTRTSQATDPAGLFHRRWVAVRVTASTPAAM